MMDLGEIYAVEQQRREEREELAWRAVTLACAGIVMLGAILYYGRQAYDAAHLLGWC